MNFCEKLKQSEFFRAMKGAEEREIAEAEKELSISFAPEYKDFLQKYGVASIKGHEFFGLGSSKRLDVVYNTKQLRADNNIMGKDCYAVEATGMDGIVIVQNYSGKVFEVKSGKKPMLLCNSLEEYITKYQ